MATAPQQFVMRPEKYRTAKIVTLIPGAITILLYILWFAFGVTLGIHLGDFTLPYAIPLTIGLLPYYWASSFVIQTDEYALITVLEKPAEEREEGYVYAPAFWTEVQRFPRPEQEDEFPGEPEQVSHMPQDEADRTKSLLLEPMFLTTGGPEEGPEADEFKDSILNCQLTLEPTIVVYWQIQLGAGGLVEFYANLPGGNNWSAKYRSVLKRMRDRAENALGIEMAKHSAAWCIKYKERLIAVVTARVRDAVENYGIIICKDVDIKNLSPHHAVNTALGLIPEATAKGEAEVITAARGAKAAVLKAKGSAKATVIEGNADGKALRRRSKQSKVSALKLLRIDAAREIGSNGQNINVGGDLMNVAQNLLGGRR